MKHIISIVLAITILVSFTACNECMLETSDNSTDVYIPRDYLSEWADSEYEVLVTDTFNSSAYIRLPSEINRVPLEEREKIANEILTRRSAAYLQTHSLPPTKEWNYYGEATLSFLDMDIIQKLRQVTYKTAEDEIEVTYNNVNGKPVRVVYSKDYVNKASKSRRQEGRKIVDSLDEAFEYAKDYIKENLDMGSDIDLYVPSSLHTYKSEDGNRYEIQMHIAVKGILICYCILRVDEYFGVEMCNGYGYSREMIDFYTSCAEYATSEEGWSAVVADLEKRAAENPDILEIKDIKLFNNGIKEGYVGFDNVTDYLYVNAYDEYGATHYYSHLDKTGVDLYCEYTAVMADGTEKKGLNVVTVFIPIDWAEEFGEK